MCNLIGHQTIVGVPGQRGGNVTFCAATRNHGVVNHHANLGPYNTHQLLISLNHMRDALLGQQDEHPNYVVVWNNVSFDRALQVREWFNMNQGFIHHTPLLRNSSPHGGGRYIDANLTPG